MESESWLGRLDAWVEAGVRRRGSAWRGWLKGRRDGWYLRRLAFQGKVMVLTMTLTLWTTWGAESLSLVECLLLQAVLPAALVFGATFLRLERHSVELSHGKAFTERFSFVLRTGGGLVCMVFLLLLGASTLSGLLGLWLSPQELWSTCHSALCRPVEGQLWLQNQKPPIRSFDSHSQLVGTQHVTPLEHWDSYVVPQPFTEGRIHAVFLLVTYPLHGSGKVRAGIGSCVLLGAALLPLLAGLLLLRGFVVECEQEPCRTVCRVGRIPERRVSVLFVNHPAMIATEMEDETEWELCLSNVRWPEQRYSTWDAFLRDGHSWVAHLLSFHANGSPG